MVFPTLGGATHRVTVPTGERLPQVPPVSHGSGSGSAGRGKLTDRGPPGWWSRAPSGSRVSPVTWWAVSVAGSGYLVVGARGTVYAAGSDPTLPCKIGCRCAHLLSRVDRADPCFMSISRPNGRSSPLWVSVLLSAPAAYTVVGIPTRWAGATWWDVGCVPGGRVVDATVYQAAVSLPCKSRGTVSGEDRQPCMALLTTV